MAGDSSSPLASANTSESDRHSREPNTSQCTPHDSAGSDSDPENACPGKETNIGEESIEAAAETTKNMSEGSGTAYEAGSFKTTPSTENNLTSAQKEEAEDSSELAPDGGLSADQQDSLAHSLLCDPQAPAPLSLRLLADPLALYALRGITHSDAESIFIHYFNSTKTQILQSFDVTEQQEAPLPPYSSPGSPLADPATYWSGDWYYVLTKIENRDQSLHILKSEDSIATLLDSFPPSAYYLYSGAYYDLCLYPVTQAFTIRFESQGGSYIPPLTKAYLENETSVQLSKEDVEKHIFDAAQNPAATQPTKEGFVFSGWYIDSACTQEAFPEINPPTDPQRYEDYLLTADTTLYAKWAIDTEASPAYVPFVATVRTENAEDLNFSNRGFLRDDSSRPLKYFAPAGSKLKVKSEYEVIVGKVHPKYAQNSNPPHPLIAYFDEILDPNTQKPREFPVYVAGENGKLNRNAAGEIINERAYLPDSYQAAEDTGAYYLFNNFAEDIQAMNGSSFNEKFTVYQNALVNSGLPFDDLNLSLNPWAEIYCQKDDDGKPVAIARRPYEAGPLAADGSSTIAFEYMRYRANLEFRINNKGSSANNVSGDYRGYLDIAKMFPSLDLNEGQNQSEVSREGAPVAWSYQAAGAQGASTDYNTYHILHVKYGENISDVFPDGVEDYLIPAGNIKFKGWKPPTDNANYDKTIFYTKQNFFTADFLKLQSSNQSVPDIHYEERDAKAITLAANKADTVAQNNAILFAFECLPGTAETDIDFQYMDKKYKVNPSYSKTVQDNAYFNNSGNNEILEPAVVNMFSGYRGITGHPSEGTRKVTFANNSQLFNSLYRDGCYPWATPADKTYNQGHELNIPGIPENSQKTPTFFNLINKYYQSLKDTSDTWGNFGHFPKTGLLGGKWCNGSEALIFIFQRERYSLTFDFNDGTENIVTFGGPDSAGGTELMFEQDISGFRYGKLPTEQNAEAPTRPGYRFLGWSDESGRIYTEQDWLGDSAGDISPLRITENRHFTAQWSPLHRVEYYPSKEAAEVGTTPAISQTFVEGGTVEKPNETALSQAGIEAPRGFLWRPSYLKEGAPDIAFPFSGEPAVSHPLIARDGQKDPQSDTPPVYVIRLYPAAPLAESIVLSYDMDTARGGNSDLTPSDIKSYQAGSQITIQPPLPGLANTITGRTFIGWKIIDADGEGTDYALPPEADTSHIFRPGERIEVQTAWLEQLQNWGGQLKLQAQWGRELTIQVKAEGEMSDRINPLFSFTTTTNIEHLDAFTLGGREKKTPDSEEVEIASLTSGSPYASTAFAHNGTLVLTALPEDATLTWSTTPPADYSVRIYSLDENGVRTELNSSLSAPSLIGKVEIVYTRSFTTPTSLFVDVWKSLALTLPVSAMLLLAYFFERRLSGRLREGGQ